MGSEMCIRDSRIETGQERTTLGPVNVRIACQNAIASLDPNAEKRGVTLRNETPEDLWVVADSGALDQVLVNLIDNALKYGADGGKVTVTAMEDGRFTRIMVEDDGPGIDPTHRDRVFERFYRIDRGRARHMGGTGIGLAIVKHLVESMGGTVGVEGVKPTGSRFWIRLNPPQNHNPPQPEL